eukprot:gene16716-biopygen11886
MRPPWVTVQLCRRDLRIRELLVEWWPCMRDASCVRDSHCEVGRRGHGDTESENDDTGRLRQGGDWGKAEARLMQD